MQAHECVGLELWALNMGSKRGQSWAKRINNPIPALWKQRLALLAGRCRPRRPAGRLSNRQPGGTGGSAPASV